jgi:hypothetical protein
VSIYQSPENISEEKGIRRPTDYSFHFLILTFLGLSEHIALARKKWHSRTYTSPRLLYAGRFARAMRKIKVRPAPP